LCKSIFALAQDHAGASGGIVAIGHRVVHGGERFAEATEIDSEVEAAIEELTPLAPMHNPLCLTGIRVARELFPSARQVAVFDTAFHRTLPESAFLYALPYAWYEQDGVRRYGFHGTSHRSVAARVAELRPDRASRLIVCHLGAGCSTAAIRDGRSIDTSMGMTPVEGLVMATRPGDVDAGAIAFVAKKHGLDVGDLEEILNRQSGLLGLSGLSGDMRELEGHAAAGNPRAELALEVFAHRVRKYIGAHHATLGVRGLEGLGMCVDPVANASCKGREAVISTPVSPIALLVVPTDEEKMIAREVHALLSGT
jgi:acetate kinase